MGRPNLKLTEETGKETRKAIAKYRDVHGLENQEAAIRHALPEWTFNPLVPPELARIKELMRDSNHFDIDLESIDIDDLRDIAAEAENKGRAELARELRGVIQSHDTNSK